MQVGDGPAAVTRDESDFRLKAATGSNREGIAIRVIWKSEDLPDEHIASPSRKWEIALDLRGQTGIPDHQKGKGDSGFFIWRASFYLLVVRPMKLRWSRRSVFWLMSPVITPVPVKALWPPWFRESRRPFIRAKNRLEVWIQLGLTRYPSGSGRRPAAERESSPPNPPPLFLTLIFTE